MGIEESMQTHILSAPGPRVRIAADDRSLEWRTVHGHH